MSAAARRRRAFAAGVALALATAIGPAAGVAAAEVDPLTPEQRAAVDRVIACARPDGGWTYVCNPASGPHGVVTKVLVRARQIQAWLGGARWDVLVMRSPGTPAAGLALLEAWRRDGDDRDLDVAKRAGDLLVATQLASGGWASEMPVVGDHLAWWFRWLNHATALDDDVTSGGARFLIDLWLATDDVKYREAAERALALLRHAQLPDGGWPLTWRPAWLRAISPSFEDLPSTNDGATAGPIHALLRAADDLGDEGALAAARRGADWLLSVQGKPPTAAWAQQYDLDGRPAAARKFEPPAYASWESREMLDAVLAVARGGGNPAHCRAASAAVAWLLRAAIAPGCWARLYSLDDDAPLYVDREGNRVATAAQAKRPYKWQGDYGIPGLLAELGVGVDGKPLPRGGVSPPRRIFGDAGACPGDVAVEDAPDEEHPRARIIRASVLLQRGEAIERSPCAGRISLGEPCSSCAAPPAAPEPPATPEPAAATPEPLPATPEPSLGGAGSIPRLGRSGSTE